MHWIAPSAKDTATGTLEKRLCDAADQFRANSGLEAQEFSRPLLGLNFLRFAEVRFAAQCGVEKTDEIGRLCRMNLAPHGLEGEISHGGQVNSYYDDPHDASGRFDFVLANGGLCSDSLCKRDIRDGLIEAEKVNSNSWKVHHNTRG